VTGKLRLSRLEVVMSCMTSWPRWRRDRLGPLSDSY